MTDTATTPTTTPTATATAPRLKQKYQDDIRAALKEQLGLTNTMQIPRLEKIVINMGVGRATQQPSLLEGAVSDLRQDLGYPADGCGDHGDRRFPSAVATSRGCLAYEVMIYYLCFPLEK